jgi:hypothetical protein
MNSKILTVFAFLVFFASLADLRAQGLPAAEKAKIESLLAHVGGLQDAKFIRNGKDYDAKTAVKFLRGKWEANEKKIHSASGFIAVAATKSSTTGKPYMIRLKGQAPVPCGEYLAAKLKAFEAAKKE